MLHIALPLSVSAVVLPSAIVGSVFLSAFFFLPDPRRALLQDRDLPLLTLEKPLVSILSRPSSPLPPDAPRGIVPDGAANCWIRAAVQLLATDRFLMELLGVPGVEEPPALEIGPAALPAEPEVLHSANLSSHGEREIAESESNSQISLPSPSQALGEPDPQLPFRNFFCAYAQAKTQATRVVDAREGSSQELRLHLSRLKPSTISPNGREEDAAEVIEFLSEQFSADPRFQSPAQLSFYYSPHGSPLIRGAEESADGNFFVVREEGNSSLGRYILVKLPLVEGPDPIVLPISLQEVFDAFFIDALEPQFTPRVGIDGNPHFYQRVRKETAYLEAPSSLYIQVGRFVAPPAVLGSKSPSQPPTAISWWSALQSRVSSWLFSPPPNPLAGWRGIKREDPVDVPDQLRLTLADGSLRQYQLKGFIEHVGRNLHYGHYKAYVLSEAGAWYECDDERISPVNPEQLPRQQAYLLRYELVPPLEDGPVLPQ